MASIFVLNAAGEPEPSDHAPRAWSEFMVHGDRQLADDRGEGETGGTVRISTVFMGVNMQVHPDGPPILWETRVFGGPLHDQSARYMYRAEALIGHQAMCRRVAKAATTAT